MRAQGGRRFLNVTSARKPTTGAWDRELKICCRRFSAGYVPFSESGVIHIRKMIWPNAPPHRRDLSDPRRPRRAPPRAGRGVRRIHHFLTIRGFDDNCCWVELTTLRWRRIRAGGAKRSARFAKARQVADKKTHPASSGRGSDQNLNASWRPA